MTKQSGQTELILHTPQVLNLQSQVDRRSYKWINDFCKVHTFFNKSVRHGSMEHINHEQ